MRKISEKIAQDDRELRIRSYQRDVDFNRPIDYFPFEDDKYLRRKEEYKPSTFDDKLYGSLDLVLR